MVEAMVFELRPPYNRINGTLSIDSRGGGGQTIMMFRNTIAMIMTTESIAAGNGLVKEDTYVHRLVDRLAVLERVAANRIIDALRISIRG